MQQMRVLGNQANNYNPTAKGFWNARHDPTCCFAAGMNVSQGRYSSQCLGHDLVHATHRVAHCVAMNKVVYLLRILELPVRILLYTCFMKKKE